MLNSYSLYLFLWDFFREVWDCSGQDRQKSVSSTTIQKLYLFIRQDEEMKQVILPSPLGISRGEQGCKPI